MKNVKYLLFCILVTVLVICALVPLSAIADSSSSDKTVYQPINGGYTLKTLEDSDTREPVAVRFSGFFFGASGITVTIDIYNSANFPIDFYINDNAANLTENQRTQRDKIINFADNAYDFINRVDASVNTQYDGVHYTIASYIYQYNVLPCGSKVEIDRYAYEMLQIAKEMYLATDGAFNPAVYRLVDLWGFSSRIFSRGDFGEKYDREVTGDEFAANGYPLPEQKYIDAFSAPAFTDFGDEAVILSQESNRYYVTKNVKPAVVDGEQYEQWLDLGGIAKGYVVDELKKSIEQIGADRYNVDAGSSSMAFGYNYGGGNTPLSISDPFDPFAAIYAPTLLTIPVGKSSVSTSGQYVRKYTTDGVEYAHIMDGALGRPAQTGVSLVTIVAPEGNNWASKGDCLTTALTVMGRDKIIDFMNGYLKDNGIEIVVLYQSLDGSKQILSNISQDNVISEGKSYGEFAWSVELNESGEYFYNASAKPAPTANKLTAWIIALGVIAGLAVVGIVIYHFAKGRKNVLANVQMARRDKPFKLADIGVYVAVALVIAVLFGIFFADADKQTVQTIKVIDLETQETLFLYSVTRNEWQSNESNGWKIAIDQTDGLIVTFTKEIGGEEHFNTMKIERGNATSVKMVDSVCGFHQECVKNFPAVSKPNGSIVCSPNRLKIITQ